ncbi:MAG: hypothetical protein B655_2332 [Methanobacterium sp. Maddingley MBC34]|nr:MAG: hypothetical protein B655_2332 [Methanobacterium sp. Maddingley MBC34]
METYYYLFFMSLTVAAIIGGLLFRIYRSSDYHQVCILE